MHVLTVSHSCLILQQGHHCLNECAYETTAMLGHVAKLTQSVRRNRSGRKQGTERGAARGQGGRQASAGARGVGASGGERRSGGRGQKS
ncbi:unnamed protein product [Prorocentrum cordatum]|uniref:Uncharacterized protein n=2 Tax=Prorocentrum cordatum TaxID=2364126 RepID=A0ABN9Y1I3_9DINO|nr:unnamed protein product [Polarella glacialis]